jgi:hypothetical protein
MTSQSTQQTWLLIMAVKLTGSVRRKRSDMGRGAAPILISSTGSDPTDSTLKYTLQRIYSRYLVFKFSPHQSSAHRLLPQISFFITTLRPLPPSLIMVNQTPSPVVDRTGRTRLRDSLEKSKRGEGPSIGQWLEFPGYSLAKTVAQLGPDVGVSRSR